jgi:hypothetical protein
MPAISMLYHRALLKRHPMKIFGSCRQKQAQQLQTDAKFAVRQNITNIPATHYVSVEGVEDAFMSQLKGIVYNLKRLGLLFQGRVSGTLSFGDFLLCFLQSPKIINSSSP